MAVTGHSWLTLVINYNTVSKAFWQKKVLPEKKISYCEGIYSRGACLFILGLAVPAIFGASTKAMQIHLKEASGSLHELHFSIFTMNIK